MPRFGSAPAFPSRSGGGHRGGAALRPPRPEATPPHAGLGGGRGARSAPAVTRLTWQWETTRLWLPSPWYFHSFSSIFSASMPGPGPRRAPRGRCLSPARRAHAATIAAPRRRSAPGSPALRRRPSLGRVLCTRAARRHLRAGQRPPPPSLCRAAPSLSTPPAIFVPGSAVPPAAIFEWGAPGRLPFIEREERRVSC